MTKKRRKGRAEAVRGGGRERLIEAALELASTTRSLSALGLRELTRHAGLNPNTFYRHFRDFDALRLALIEQLGGGLRRALRERRRPPVQAAVAGTPAQMLAQWRELVRASVTLVLDFVAQHRAPCIVGFRELHGSSPLMREAMRHLLDEIAVDLAEDLRLQLPQEFDPDMLREISRQVIYQMTFLLTEYLEQPARREAVLGEAERFVLRIFSGEALLRGSSPGPANAGRPA